MVGNPYYGAMGDVSTVFLCVCSPDYLQQLNASYEGCFLFAQVQDSSDVISEGRVRVVFSVPCEPQLDALIQNQHVSLESVRITHSPLYSVTESCFIYLTLYLLVEIFVLLLFSDFTNFCFHSEILGEVLSRVRARLSPWYHQLPRLKVLRQHLHWKRIQKKVSGIQVLKETVHTSQFIFIYIYLISALFSFKSIVFVNLSNNFISKHLGLVIHLKC